MAKFSLAYPSPSDARLVERSLRPEIGDIEADRTRATLERDGSVVSICLSAEDLVAVRAGLNTWLTLADVAERAAGVASS